MKKLMRALLKLLLIVKKRKRCKGCGVILFPEEHKVEKERGICIGCDTREWLSQIGKARNG